MEAPERSLDRAARSDSGPRTRPSVRRVTSVHGAVIAGTLPPDRCDLCPASRHVQSGFHPRFHGRLMIMRRLLSVAFLVTMSTLALGCLASALAQPFVVQTSCETLSTSPPQVRVTFGVGNTGTIPVCSVHLVPLPGPAGPDSCRILECSHPPGWVCDVDSLSGGAFWRTVPGAPCVDNGQKHDGFDIILDPLFCCYQALFDDGNGSVFYVTQVCFECEKPTSADRS